MQPIKTLATALALSSALTASGYAATKVGVIGAANPQVYVKAEDGNERALKVGDEIFLNDEVRTDGKGSAQLMFLDKSALTVSPGSTVTIDKFVYDPARKDGSMSINGAKGAFRFIGGALTKKKAVKIKTPVSTIGIRGGIVDTHISTGGETDAVFLFGKEMTMTNGQGQTSSTNQFGTGLGLQTPDAAPQNLPRNIVTTRINNSPTAAAVRVAPVTENNQINTLQNKVNINTTGDGSTGGSTNGGGTSGGNSGNSGAAPAGNTSGGASNNSGGENADSPAVGGPATDGGPVTGGENTDGGPAAGGENALNFDGAPAGDSTGPDGSFSELAGDGFGNEGPAPGGPNDLGPIEVAAVGSNDAAQEDLRDGINNFVQTGGDANGDGQLDFDITGAVPNDPNGGPNDPNTPGFFDQLFGDGGFFGPDGGPNDPNAPGPNEEFPIGEGPTDGPIDGPIVEDPNANDPADNTPTPPPAGGGGGGGGATNLAPNVPRETLTGGIQAETPYRTTGIDTFSSAVLLNNATDPESDTLSIVAGSGSVTTANAMVTVTGGSLILDLDDDIAPGDVETVTVEYDVTDGTNIVRRTADVIIQGEDHFGGTDAWSTSLPMLPSGPDTFGRTVRYDSGAGPLIESGKVLGYYNGTDGTWDGIIDESVSTPMSNDLTIVSVDNVTGPGYISTALTDANVLLERETGELDLAAFTGQSFTSTDQSMHYYRFEWDEAGNTQAINYVFGKPVVSFAPDFGTGAFTLADIDGFLPARLDEAATYANTNFSSNGIVAYDFLPESYSFENSDYGFFDYNYFEDPANNSFIEATSHTILGAEDNLGLLVDWNKRQFFTGHVDFIGDVVGTAVDPESGLIVSFGKVKDNTADIGPGINPDFHVSGGNMFQGYTFEASLGDEDATPDGIQADEIFGTHGFTEVKPDSLYGIDDAADNPIEGFVFGGTVDYSGDGMANPSDPGDFHINQPVTESFHNQPNLRDLATKIGSVDQTSLDHNNTPGTISYRQDGYYGGLMFDAADNASRVRGRVRVNIDQDHNAFVRMDNATGAPSGDDAMFVDGVNSQTGQTTMIFGHNSANPTANAALGQDLYAAEYNPVVSAAQGGLGPAAGIQAAVVAAPHIDSVQGTNGAGAPESLVCTSCEFAHWGVWSMSEGTVGGADAYAAMIPYVAGEATEYNSATWASTVGMLGDVTYNGDAVASIALTKTTGGSVGDTQYINQLGTMIANIDLTNRELDGMTISFNDIGGDVDRDLTIFNTATVAFDNGVTNPAGTHENHVKFNSASSFSGSFSDHAGQLTSNTPTGRVDGLLYGTNAEEFGGSFHVQANTSDVDAMNYEDIKAGGIFLGKR